MARKISRIVDKLPAEHRQGLERALELEELERGPMSEEEVLYRRIFNAPPPTTASQRLLHAYRVHRGSAAKPISFYRASRLLSLTNQRLYQIKEGEGGAMSDHIAVAICQELYQNDPARDARTDQWLCEIAAERAECNNQPELAKRWRRIATRVAALAFPLVLWLPMDAEALVAQAELDSDYGAINIMLNRLRQFLSRRRRLVSHLFGRDWMPGAGPAAGQVSFA